MASVLMLIDDVSSDGPLTAVMRAKLIEWANLRSESMGMKVLPVKLDDAQNFAVQELVDRQRTKADRKRWLIPEPSYCRRCGRQLAVTPRTRQLDCRTGHPECDHGVIVIERRVDDEEGEEKVR